MWEKERSTGFRRAVNMTTAKRAVPLLLVVPLLAVVASCVESQQPLSDEKSSKIDERLIGTWQIENDATATYYVKGSADTKNCLDVELKEKDKSGVSRARVFTTTVKTKNYMSTVDMDEKAKKEQKGAYFIHQYRFLDHDTLDLRFMAHDVLKKAMAEKLIAGKIEENGATITDSPERIKRYLEAHADECYPAKTDLTLILKRQK